MDIGATSLKLKTKEVTEAVWRLSYTHSIGATVTVPGSDAGS